MTEDNNNNGNGKATGRVPVSSVVTVDDSLALLKDDVIEELTKCSTLSEACRRASVPPSTGYSWKYNDPAFALRVIEAINVTVDHVESAIIKRAAEGIEEYVISQGLPVPDPENDGKFLKRRVYSDKLAEFYLRGRRKEVFGDKQEISGPGGGPVGVQLYMPKNTRSKDLAK